MARKLAFGILICLFLAVLPQTQADNSDTPLAAKLSYTAVFQYGVNGYYGSQDVEIASWYPDTNYDGGINDTMEIRTNDQLAGLIQFDVSSIPTNAMVTRATLSVYAPERYGPRSLTVGAYEVYRRWVASQATWNEAEWGARWAMPGCNDTSSDRSADPESNVTMFEIWRWYDFDITNMVQKWVRHPNRNHGLVFKAFGTSAGIKMVTSEHGGTWMHPKLTVSYVLATPTPTPSPTSENTPTPTRTRTLTPTATRTPGPCDGLHTTPYFTQYYGTVGINGFDAPVGALIEMFSPRDERVGCVVTTAAGVYPYARTYGEDINAVPLIPGMRAGEAVSFKVNGLVAATDPSPVLWQDDKATHRVNLSLSTAAATATPTITSTRTPVVDGLGVYLPLLLKVRPPLPPTPTPTATKLSNPCDGLATTPYFTQYFGIVTVNGVDTPPGTLIEMYSPRGDRVGCVVTTMTGIYPYTRVYGEDSTANPPIPGMRAGEAVSFKVNGVVAATSPSPVLWQDDKQIHRIDLSVSTSASATLFPPTITR